MKRIHTLAILFLLFFIGCGHLVGDETVPTASVTSSVTKIPELSPTLSPPPTSTPSPTVSPLPTPTDTPTPTPTRALTLLDGKTAVGTSQNVWRVDCEAIEEIYHPELYEMGENFVVYSIRWDEEEIGTMTLSIVSQRDGSLLATTSFFGDGLIDISISEDKIAVADSAAGTVTIYNDSLEVLTQYTLEADWENWYLSPDFEKLYIVKWAEGITQIDLATKESKVILSDAADLYIKGNSATELAITYEDLRLDRTTCMILNKQEGKLYETPYQHRTASEIYHEGDTWLFQDYGVWGRYYLYRMTENGYRVDTFDHMYGCELLENGLLLCGGDYDRTMYAPDGTFISRCALTEDDGFFRSDMLYSDLWGGYFFTVVFYDGSSALMFWDAEVPAEGEPLSLIEYKQELPGGVSAEAQLYERARALSEQYGVDIRIADQCTLTYSHYKASELNSTALITEGLNYLEEALASYPEGFFEQLCYGQIERIQIELVDCLNYTGSAAKLDSTAAFAQDKGTYYLIVADVPVVYTSTYYHEFSHVIDKKLMWDARFREDALFSEDTWRSFLPEDFQFAYSYGGIEECFATEEYYQYFVSSYGMSYPTEDRATLMQEAMSDHRISFEIRPKLIERMEYYSSCIRDCFDTTGWPEQTQWEGVRESVKEN